MNFIKRPEAIQYERDALLQLSGQLKDHVMFEAPVWVRMVIYYPSRRQDLDPSLILDVLEKAEVYKNDRLVEEMHLFRRVDKINSRAEISIGLLYNKPVPKEGTKKTN